MFKSVYIPISQAFNLSFVGKR